MFLNAQAVGNDIVNTVAKFRQSVKGSIGSDKANVINPELFYTKQLLDTIRLDANEYSYYRYAEEMPIQDKADKLTVRRWAPLQAHTVPLVEGIPPISDRGSVETYEMQASQYGRYMEFTDRVDFQAVDPIIAHYSNEYSIVAIETLDLLAQQAMLAVASQWFAGTAASQAELNLWSVPQIADFRLIGLSLKKQLVKPRSNGRFHVLVSPEFVYDMMNDPYVWNYMKINQSTGQMYDNCALIPMFGFEFYEVMNCPTSASFVSGTDHVCLVYKDYDASGIVSADVPSGWTISSTVKGDWVNPDDATEKYSYAQVTIPSTAAAVAGGWVADSRTGADASYIPAHTDYDAAVDNGTFGSGVKVLKFQHTIVLGKDALVRTGLAGEGAAKMYVKPLGSAGVLDPIDQRQSIGFKINSVGFGSTRLEAIVDYINVPSQLN